MMPLWFLFYYSNFCQYSIKWLILSKLIDAVKSLIKEVIYFNSTAEEIANSFNPNFNKQLLGLIAQILTHHLPNWRKEV